MEVLGPKIHEKEEFLAFCKTKGSKRFDPTNPFTCALTQFFKSIYPTTHASVSYSIATGLPFAEERFGKTLGYLRLEPYEIERVFSCRTFSKVVKVLTDE
jgi:hypothetical protein